MELPSIESEYCYNFKQARMAGWSISSTESRLLLKTGLIKKTYNVDEYQGKFFYFNRIIRPGYYNKSIIPENDYFDHCYDCTYFSYIIKNYLDKFSKYYNPFMKI